MLESADQQEQVSVRLLNRPFEPVSLAVYLSEAEHLVVSPTLVQFDADNWDQPQWVTVQARKTLRVSLIAELFHQPKKQVMQET